MEKENKRISLIVDDDSAENAGTGSSKKDKFKKPVIFGLMAIVFIACLYLIFKPKNGGEEDKIQV
jgi:hypothetical protein